MELEEQPRGRLAWRFSLALVLSWMICILLATGLLWSMVSIRQDLRARMARVELTERNLKLEMLELRRQLSIIQESKGDEATMVSNEIISIKDASEVPDEKSAAERIDEFGGKNKKTFSNSFQRIESVKEFQYQKDERDNDKDSNEVISEAKMSVRQKRGIVGRKEHSKGDIEKSSRFLSDNRKISRAKFRSGIKSLLQESGVNMFGKKIESMAKDSSTPKKRSQRTGIVWITKNNPIARELLKKHPIAAKQQSSPKVLTSDSKKGHYIRDQGFEDDEDFNEGSGCSSCGDIRHEMDLLVAKVNSQILQLRGTRNTQQLQLKCRNATSEWNTTYNIGVSKFLASHYLTCQANELLQSFKLKGNKDEFFPLYRYEYRCCSLSIE